MPKIIEWRDKHSKTRAWHIFMKVTPGFELLGLGDQAWLSKYLKENFYSSDPRLTMVEPDDNENEGMYFQCENGFQYRFVYSGYPLEVKAKPETKLLIIDSL